MKIGELRIEKLTDGSYEGALKLFGGCLRVPGNSPKDLEDKMRELGAIE